MYLKRLELRGFKTFADRTELEFGPGITAIVGPNGAGKSNLFDAIRWVLGETSWRALRTHRTEDVIFAGTSTRRPHGLAQVDLTVDNESGILPLPFAEVTVTRRATRAGEGEFFLNGVPCRLRDIQMAFLGTGLGGRGYAMIGQGEVESLVNASPEERRAVLEEAAGLTRPKRRRGEAERRLAHASQNLERVTDLLAELEARRDALALQAEAAREYRETERALRETELLLHVEAARRTRAQLRRALAAAESARKRYEAACTRARDVEGAWADARGRHDEAAALLEAAQRELVRAVEAARTSQAQVQLLEERLRACEERIRRTERDLGQLLRERHGGADVLEALRDRERAWAEEVARLEEVVRGETSRLEATTSALRAFAEEVERLRADVFELEHARAQTRNQLTALHARRETLRIRSAQLTDHLMHRWAERADAKTRRQDLQDRIARREADLEALVGRITALRAECASVEAELERVQAEERDAALACAVHRARLDTLERRGFGGEDLGELLRVRPEVPELSGVRGVLVEFVDADPENRAAVEAALGDSLFALVVSSLGDARAARAWLRARGGRAEFLVPDLVGPQEEREAPEGGVPALELVRCDPTVAPLVRAMLADTWVVPELETAVALRTRGFRGRLVTWEGDVLEPNGTWCMPHVPERTDPPAGLPDGPLARASEMAALRAQLAALEDHHAALQERIGELRTRIAHIREEIDEAVGTRSATEAGLEALRWELARLEEALARSQPEEAARELGEVRSELERLDEQEARLTADLAALEGGLRRVRAELDSALKRAADAEREREEVVGAVGRARDGLSEALTQLSTVRGRIAEREAAHLSLDSRIAALRAEQDSLIGERAQLIAQIQEATSQLAAARAEEEAVRRRITEAAQARERAAQEVSALQAEQEAVRAAVREHEEALRRAEVRRAHLEAEWEAAASRIREEFGVGFEEADVVAPRDLDREVLLRRVEDLRARLLALGAVNLRAQEEHEELTARIAALRAQVEDIEAARTILQDLMARVEWLMDRQFRKTFQEVDGAFGDCFRRLFGGGTASLVRVVGEDGTEGVEITVQPPGRKVRQLGALSGGERVMVALALVFALLRVHPSPFCVFDEIEAALDEANTQRVAELLRELTGQSQVVIITHNKATMEAADMLYGVTMDEPGVSRIVSVRIRREEPVEVG
mgnify:FL=1